MPKKSELSPSSLASGIVWKHVYYGQAGLTLLNRYQTKTAVFILKLSARQVEIEEFCGARGKSTHNLHLK